MPIKNSVRGAVELTTSHLPKNMSACFGFLLITRVVAVAAVVELDDGRVDFDG